MATESMVRGLKQAKPFILVILLQFGAAGLNLFIKIALNQGMNQHVLVVYRHIFATLAIAPFALVLERKTRPKMTYSIFFKIFVLGLLEPVIDQNLFFTGMKFTTATFGAAMGNILPAFVFIMAWIIGLEKVNIRRIHSQAKMFGTVVTLGGAMLMTMFKGPALGFPWTSQSNDHAPSSPESSQISGKGAGMIGAGCVCWASFIILQTITLKTYPAELSLTALICVMGATQGSFVALALEWGNPSAWAVHVDATLFAYLYTGIISSGIGYYVQGLVIKEKGPVFVTAFNPLCMIIVALLSSFILSEMMYLGRIIGGVVIIIGLYMVLWGKSDDESPSESSKKVLAPEDETANKTELIPFDGNKGRVGDESV